MERVLFHAEGSVCAKPLRKERENLVGAGKEEDDCGLRVEKMGGEKRLAGDETAGLGRGPGRGEPSLRFRTIPWSLREATVTISSSYSTFPPATVSQDINLITTLLLTAIPFLHVQKEHIEWHSWLGKCTVRLRSRNGDCELEVFWIICSFIHRELDVCVFVWNSAEYVSSFTSFEWSPNGPPSVKFYSVVNIYKYILVHFLRVYMFLNVWLLTSGDVLPYL